MIRLSQKNTSMSIFPSAIMPPISKSPPSGPLRRQTMEGASGPSFSVSVSETRRPVVPVQNKWQCFSEPAL